MTESTVPILAIDGPAGVGKSSVCRAVAEKTGWMLVETGAIYRSVGLLTLEAGGDPAHEAEVVPHLGEVDISFSFDDGKNRVFLGARDVTDRIHEPDCSMAASSVSAHPAVRAALLDLQRSFARRGDVRGVILEGRDIGTVVFPNAPLKIFLTASVDERARRRHLQLQASGRDIPLDEVRRDVVQRDHQDSSRAVAPLKQADDAVVVDTTDMTFDESIDAIVAEVHRVYG